MRLRRILLVVAVLGVLFACAGLVQTLTAANSTDIGNARPLLVVAWLILTPLFVYMMTLRGRARRVARDRALEEKRTLDAEVARLRTPEGIRAIAQAEEPPEHG
jgi:hypothetical protein